MTLREDGGLGYRVSCEVKPESWLDIDVYRRVAVRPTGCSQDNIELITNNETKRIYRKEIK